jgi:apolipoprotein D and lipocalin family protein
MRNLTLLATALLALTACASTGGAKPEPGDLRPVPRVDLPRYMGEWFVIANIPYFAEKNCHDSVESYALRADGRIDNWFECREGSFEAPMKRKLTTVATVHDTRSNAEWRVPFFRILKIKYFVIDLDPEYQWAVIGHPSRRFGWIIARSRALPDETYARLLQGVREQGYDPAQFVKVPHSRQE